MFENKSAQESQEVLEPLSHSQLPGDPAAAHPALSVPFVLQRSPAAAGLEAQ